MHKYDVEMTDTYGGEANYSWVRRAVVTMPELTHYGYDGGTNHSKANRVFERELMRRAKAKLGMTGVRGRTYSHGDTIEFRPYRACVVVFITYSDADNA